MTRTVRISMSENPLNVSGIIRSLISAGSTHSALRFIFVGGLNTLFGYSLFAVFIYSGLHYVLASLLGTMIGVIFNYYTTGRYVFARNEGQLINFIAVYAIAYCANITFLKTGTYFIANIYINGAVCTLINAYITYHLYKQFVFSRPG